MKRDNLPTLPDTGRHYVERTGRARLASPGVERYQRARSQAPTIAITIAIAVALVGAMVWLS